jgi:hypothetical protein
MNSSNAGKYVCGIGISSPKESTVGFGGPSHAPGISLRHKPLCSSFEGRVAAMFYRPSTTPLAKSLRPLAYPVVTEANAFAISFAQSHAPVFHLGIPGPCPSHPREDQASTRRPCQEPFRQKPGGSCGLP